MYNFIFQLTIQEERHKQTVAPSITFEVEAKLKQMLMVKVLSSHNNKAQDTCEFGLIEA